MPSSVLAQGINRERMRPKMPGARWVAVSNGGQERPFDKALKAASNMPWEGGVAREEHCRQRAQPASAKARRQECAC